MPSRIGVFICECGPNIKEMVDTEELATDVRSVEGVVFAGTFNLLCAPRGIEAIVTDILKGQLDRIVVAGCSPGEHEKTFRDALKNAGLNPFLLQMANIREQCAWVTPNREEATEKAKLLLRSAVARITHHISLEEKFIECRTEVLVIGAGMAGISAVLTLTQENRRVYLVEKQPCIGGHAALFEEISPKQECSACVIAPFLDQVLHHDHIEVLTFSEVENVRGAWGNFKVRIKSKSRCVDPAACLGCRACLSVCPVEVPDEFNQGLSKRKAIYIPYDGALPHVATIDKSACLRFKGGECTACRDACAFEAIDYTKQDDRMVFDVGAIIIATGFSLFDPGQDSRFGHGSIANVLTALEFERLLNRNGPTGGQPLLKSGERPHAIAFIHCVGSRSESRYRHCSGICCSYLLKLCLQTQRLLPDIRTEQLYVDFCLPGKDAQGLLFRAAGLPGFSAHRLLNPEAVQVAECSGRISVSYTDDRGVASAVCVDMVVLGPAMIGAETAEPLGGLFEVGRDEAGFWVSSNSLLAPVETNRKGVLIAGCGQGPLDIPGSIAQGQAAAGWVLQHLVPGRKLPLEVTAAVMDEQLCSGCKSCQGACDYGAIVYDVELKRASVNPLLCRGCGCCAVACPSGAVTAPQFTDAAIRSELSGSVENATGGDGS